MNDEDIAYYAALQERKLAAAKEYKKQHAEEIRLKKNEYMREYYRKNPEVRERAKAAASARRKENPDRHRDENREWARKKRAEDENFGKAASQRYRQTHQKEVQERTLAWAHARPGVYLYYNAKYRAKRLGLPFDLEKSDIVVPEVCPVLGIPIDPNKRGRGSISPNSPSVDRIIPERGYVKGNICVISWRANDLKKDATLAELKALVAYLEAA